MGNIDLEELVNKNISSLKYIMSKDEIILLDTSVFLRFKMDMDLFDIINKYPTDINNKVLCLYKSYLENIFDCANLNDFNLTVPEVTDKEIFTLKKAMEKRVNSLNNFLSVTKEDLKNTEIINLKQNIRHIKHIGILFEALEKILSENNLCENVFLPNQFSREIYEEYELIINQMYKVFKPKKYENLCADDGLIAGALIFLQRLEKPINIISNDTGVSLRLWIFNSLISHFKDEDENPFYKNLHNLLNSVGISFYSNLNKKNIYRFYGTTKNSNWIFNLKKNKMDSIQLSNHLNYFSYVIERINSLEQKYAEHIKI